MSDPYLFLRLYINILLWTKHKHSMSVIECLRDYYLLI